MLLLLLLLDKQVTVFNHTNFFGISMCHQELY